MMNHQQFLEEEEEEEEEINYLQFLPRRISINNAYTNRSDGQKRRRINEKKKLEFVDDIINNNQDNGSVLDDDNNNQDHFFLKDDSMIIEEEQQQYPYLNFNFEGGDGNDFYDIGEDLEEESLNNNNEEEEDDDDNNSDDNDGISLAEENDYFYDNNQNESDSDGGSSAASNNNDEERENLYNESFHLKFELNYIVKTMQSKHLHQKHEIKQQQLLYEEDGNTSTVLDLYLFIKNIIAEYGGSIKMERDLFHGICKYAIPSHSPFHNYIKNTDYSYNEITDINTAKFDVCGNCGGTVFVGDYHNATQCQNNNCKSKRFNPCSICERKKNNDISNIQNGECNHRNRTSIKEIHYNYFIPSIVILIQNDGFHNCLNDYTFYNYNNGGSYNTESSFIRDTSDGKAYMIADDQMNTQFKNLKVQKAISNGFVIDANTVQVKLILSLFYDGVQVYKKKVVNCSPLTLTILNLPPNIRNMQGVGNN